MVASSALVGLVDRHRAVLSGADCALFLVDLAELRFHDLFFVVIIFRR
jgi:hypothetical protein